ncbi:MAG: NFACT RNA binding domain-containing protein [Candidatus Pacearchaeota archaeon]
MEDFNYFKYRWFYTSSDKLVIGGKNAEQNEEVLKRVIESGKKLIVMHTRSPGSPFSIILSEKYTASDLEESAIFTACFSRAWREGKRREIVDIFSSKQLIKEIKMKKGTFGVMGKIRSKGVYLKLYLTFQKDKFRAVPQKINEAISIVPGNIKKNEFSELISKKFNIKKEEVLNALPSGGFSICQDH